MLILVLGGFTGVIVVRGWILVGQYHQGRGLISFSLQDDQRWRFPSVLVDWGLFSSHFFLAHGTRSSKRVKAASVPGKTARWMLHARLLMPVYNHGTFIFNWSLIWIVLDFLCDYWRYITLLHSHVLFLQQVSQVTCHIVRIFGGLMVPMRQIYCLSAGLRMVFRVGRTSLRQDLLLFIPTWSYRWSCSLG